VWGGNRALSLSFRYYFIKERANDEIVWNAKMGFIHRYIECSFRNSGAGQHRLGRDL
jgi:hypothetical protein